MKIDVSSQTKNTSSAAYGVYLTNSLSAAEATDITIGGSLSVVIQNAENAAEGYEAPVNSIGIRNASAGSITAGETTVMVKGDVETIALWMSGSGDITLAGGSLSAVSDTTGNNVIGLCGQQSTSGSVTMGTNVTLDAEGAEVSASAAGTVNSNVFGVRWWSTGALTLETASTVTSGDETVTTLLDGDILITADAIDGSEGLSSTRLTNIAAASVLAGTAEFLTGSGGTVAMRSNLTDSTYEAVKGDYVYGLNVSGASAYIQTGTLTISAATTVTGLTDVMALRGVSKGTVTAYAAAGIDIDASGAGNQNFGISWTSTDTLLLSTATVTDGAASLTDGTISITATGLGELAANNDYLRGLDLQSGTVTLETGSGGKVEIISTLSGDSLTGESGDQVHGIRLSSSTLTIQTGTLTISASKESADLAPLWAIQGVNGTSAKATLRGAEGIGISASGAGGSVTGIEWRTTQALLLSTAADETSAASDGTISVVASAAGDTESADTVQGLYTTSGTVTFETGSAGRVEIGALVTSENITGTAAVTAKALLLQTSGNVKADTGWLVIEADAASGTSATVTGIETSGASEADFDAAQGISVSAAAAAPGTVSGIVWQGSGSGDFDSSAGSITVTADADGDTDGSTSVRGLYQSQATLSFTTSLTEDITFAASLSSTARTDSSSGSIYAINAAGSSTLRLTTGLLTVAASKSSGDSVSVNALTGGGTSVVTAYANEGIDIDATGTGGSVTGVQWNSTGALTLVAGSIDAEGTVTEADKAITVDALVSGNADGSNTVRAFSMSSGTASVQTGTGEGGAVKLTAALTYDSLTATTGVNIDTLYLTNASAFSVETGTLELTASAASGKTATVRTVYATGTTTVDASAATGISVSAASATQGTVNAISWDSSGESAWKSSGAILVSAAATGERSGNRAVAAISATDGTVSLTNDEDDAVTVEASVSSDPGSSASGSVKGVTQSGAASTVVETGAFSATALNKSTSALTVTAIESAGGGSGSLSVTANADGAVDESRKGIAVTAQSSGAGSVTGISWGSTGEASFESSSVISVTALSTASVSGNRNVTALSASAGKVSLNNDEDDSVTVQAAVSSDPGDAASGSVRGIALSGEASASVATGSFGATAVNSSTSALTVKAVEGSGSGDLTVTARAADGIVIEAASAGAGAVTAMEWLSTGAVLLTAEAGDVTLSAAGAGEGTAAVTALDVKDGAVTVTPSETGTVTVTASGTGRTGIVRAIRASRTASSVETASADEGIATAAEDGESAESVENEETANVVISSDWLEISAEAAEGGIAVAVEASDGGTVELTATGTARVTADDFLMLATNGGEISLDASATVSTTELAGDIAAIGTDSQVTTDAGTGAKLTGNIYAADGGTVTMDLNTDGVFTGMTDSFTGYTYSALTESDRAAVLAAASSVTGVSADSPVTSSGTISLTLEEGSKWNVTDDSWLTLLTADQAEVDLSYGSSTTDYTRVTTDTLSGSDSTFRISIDLANESASSILTDQLVMTNGSTEEASHLVDIVLVGDEPASDKYLSVNWLISQTNDSAYGLTFTTTDTVAYNGSTKTWELKYITAEEAAAIAAVDWSQEDGTSDGSAGNWYLVRSDTTDVPDPTPTPSPTPTPETQPVDPIMSARGRYLAWRADLSDLRKRLGEVRYGAQDGVWAKVIYERERAGSLRQKTRGVHFGADGYVTNTEDRAWLLGGSLKFATADQEIRTGRGEGELDQYLAKLYATYSGKSGAYADFVLAGGFFEQEMEVLSNQRNTIAKADYSTFGFGISAEVGHMLSFGEGVDDRQWYDHWFIEPQLQLAYFWTKGADWTSSTGMTAEQDDAQYLTGRAGVVAGKKWNYGGIDDLDRRFLQVALRAGFIHEFLGDQKTTLNGDYVVESEFDGTTFYYGINADWAYSPVEKLYLTVERERGSGYRKDLSLRFGWRHEF
ncbi:autotransporter outer membrane beta-barrel domain-containing protein [Sutterella sp.]|uniref:autotransporter outer membrane beta-barrel domain-containing protein n=1 Tax=Sutterella sp. TaxID=1981025 RepID=UPI0026E0F0F7|nr:autotransporter outer membrane beta-barrel domain-containing protein [Sutterella sp.]MDO5532254.1 autotransporter outer membrane beta-barrel domain-containing protein [Sutterella sp.]